MDAIARTSSSFSVIIEFLIIRYFSVIGQLNFKPFLRYFSQFYISFFSMKLDTEVYRYLTRDDLRVLTAVEMGSKNHELVAPSLIDSIANLKRGGVQPIIKELHKYKLLYHESLPYHGFRLTYSGYDCLAICTLTQRGVICGVGRRVGVGKESDVHVCFAKRSDSADDSVYSEDSEDSECSETSEDEDTVPLILKLHRLGRISFRTVKQNRDYLKNRKNASWMYMARLAAEKEFSYAKILYERGFPVPKPIDCNRHCIVMEKIPGKTLYQLAYEDLTDDRAESLLIELYGIITRLGEIGLIHGDFNEFNLMYSESRDKVYVIDFPQVVRMDHANAEFYFNRDVQGVANFFEKRFGIAKSEFSPKFSKVFDTYKTNSLSVVESNKAFDDIQPPQLCTDEVTEYADDLSSSCSE